MSDIARLFQQQVPLDSKVKIFLTNGKEVIGTLDEISRGHVTLRNNGKPLTILLNMIGGWEVVEEVLHQTYGLSLQEGQVESTITQDLVENADTGQDTLETSLLATTKNRSVLPDDGLGLEVYTKLIEINANLQARLEVARIEIVQPSFVFPTDELHQPAASQKDVRNLWDRFINKYKYAVKVNELSTTHGRLPNIISDLEELSRWCPHSPSVSDHLAYFYYLAGQKQKALETYKKAAFNSKTELGWGNLAAIALECSQEELACYSLEQFFRQSPITEPWYLFVRLLMKFSNYCALKSLWEIILARKRFEQEFGIFIDTLVFLLKVTGKEGLAQEIIQGQLEENHSYEMIVFTALENFEKQPTEAYQKFLSELGFINQVHPPPALIEKPNQHKGYVHMYKSTYGFLRDQDGQEYFFHSSAVIDADLLPKLKNLFFEQEIPVTFELAQGPKGDTIAVSISAFRTVDETFKLALRYANEGEYHNAIRQIKKVLAAEPENPKAQALHEKWREYARVAGVPKGKNPYARAKQLQLIEKDPQHAEELFRLAIKKNDNKESAVKDLAQLLDQLGRTEEAIELLKMYRSAISDKQSVDNLLTGLYSKAGSYDQAITLLNEKLQGAKTSARKISLLWQIGSAYLRQEKYAQAEEHFRQILRIQQDNQAAERNLAICLFKQERLDEAEKILNRVLNTSPDTRAAELLDAIKQAKQTGYFGDIIVELTLSELYFSGEVSRFAQFFLDRCHFEGVRPERVAVGEFSEIDVKQLENLAAKLGPKRPSQRAAYFLSAAKIVTELDETDEFGRFHEYLCRSFVSMADAAVDNKKHIDTVRELYCEALSIYDYSRGKGLEREAEIALVRYLYATLGTTQIPLTPKTPTIRNTLEDIISLHPEPNRVFDTIAYLVNYSRYGANNTLNQLYSRDKQYSWRPMALEYLRGKGVYENEKTSNLADFVKLWNELGRKHLKEIQEIAHHLQFIRGIKLTTAGVEPRIEVIKKLILKPFFELDQRRLRQIQTILEIAADLCRQEKFSDQERLAEQIERNCQELLTDIESNPTKISIEEMYRVVETIQKEIRRWKEELYERSIPELSLHLPIEAYIPYRNQLDVQVAVGNRVGCSPAESLELIVHQDETLFSVTKTGVKLHSSLEGGDSDIIQIPLRVTEHALASQAFSLPLHARYRTRSGDIVETPEYNFSIRLSSEDDFEEIHNPYAPYAESGIVEDPQMFYGREELIQNMAWAIQNAKTKSVVVYGQKRAGKSSILFHLKKKLQTDKSLLVLDWGNIGSIRDKYSQTPLLYQILWGILEQLQFALEDKVEEGFTSLELPLPFSSLQFYSHPDPLTFFNEIFGRYKRKTSKLAGWENVRIVLLIDEFTYIFDWILKGEISDSFMKNWKALLQENYFSAVLVGQDYMPKFKLRFPNEFGTTQDERVTYLRREDAIRLIDEPLRIGGRQGESRYREQAIETIFTLTAGSPFYIQIICNRLVEYMNRKRAKFVTEADVKQVRNDLITGVNALDVGKFDNLINSGDTSSDAISDDDALKVLTAIALNSRTGLCNRSNIACETQTPVDEILRDLVNREVIEQRDQNYRIRVELFKEWLMAHPVR